MKVSELSQRSGVPVGTVKYYLRERLLPAGIPLASNQASYGEGHVQRLRLIRILQTVGGLSLAGIKDVVRLLDESKPEIMPVLGAALDPLGARTSEQEAREGTREWQTAAQEVDAFLDQVGWPPRAESQARKTLVDALLTLREGWPDMEVQAFLPYVRAMGELAQHEVAHVMEALEAGPSEALEAVVMGTVLWEPVMLSLRRIAHEQLSRRVLSSSQPQKPCPEGKGDDA